jgi:hypothetical protein
MDELVLAAYIAGYFTIFGAVAGTILPFLFLTLKERYDRINNQNRLIIELLLLKSAFATMKIDVETAHEIKSSDDLFMITRILMRATPLNKIKKLQNFFMKSIIIDIENPLIFARFTGVRNLITGFIEEVDDLKKLSEFPDQKDNLNKELDLIIEKTARLIDEIYDLRFINRVKKLLHQIFLRSATSIQKDKV